MPTIDQIRRDFDGALPRTVTTSDRDILVDVTLAIIREANAQASTSNREVIANFQARLLSYSAGGNVAAAETIRQRIAQLEVDNLCEAREFTALASYVADCGSLTWKEQGTIAVGDVGQALATAAPWVGTVILIVGVIAAIVGAAYVYRSVR